MNGFSKVLTSTREGCPLTYLIFAFRIGRASLLAPHREFLFQRIVRIMENPENRVTLIGRASRTGSDANNQRLSQRRAEAVARYLTSKGVANDRMDVQHVGSSQPLGSAREDPEDRSVEIQPQISTTFRLVLVDAASVPKVQEMTRTISNAFAPAVRSAGRTLVIERSVTGQTSGDVTLHFLRGGHETRPCGLLFLGDEGGGNVYVGAHEDLRVCGVPRRVGRDPTDINYAAQIQRLFDRSEPEFARAVANTALHELGHVLGLGHASSTTQDIMFSHPQRGARLPRHVRTLENARRNFAGVRSFTQQQLHVLMCSIKSGYYPGGMRVGSP